MLNKDHLLAGGASLIAGYLGASLIDHGIAHHAGCPAGCTPTTCPTQCPPASAARPPPAAKPSSGCNCSALASPPNTLNCSEVDRCRGQCNLVSEFQVCNDRARAKSGLGPVIPKDVGTAAQVAPDILGTSQPGADPACSTNCGPPLADPICNLNKVIHQCGGFNSECIPGVNIPCGVLLAGGAFLLILAVIKR